MAKNIVLLSDGTGQRGGIGAETNVWHLYQALTHNDRQVLCYDDGVGSQDFAVFKAIGGAFGWGLARNIRELYTFLARTWEADDNIFMFGFSRGAFTVRLLAGMVTSCGLLDLRKVHSEQELDRMTRTAYCAYRASQFFPGVTKRFRETYGRKDIGDGKIPVHFVGVWDTVNAMGVPMDELRDAIDNVLRYSFHDRVLSPLVRFGRHAVAIDEARKTFHPLMWDERLESCERIQQVWFAGVHSNVGGGYPKRQLAMVSLNWMAGEARDKGLLIDEQRLEDIANAADPHGRLYDSRRGPAAWYRYQPRDLEAIRQAYSNGKLRIHRSVLDRIEQATDRYSPHNLSPELRVLGDRRPVPTFTARWKEAMEYACALTWWRQVVYFALLGVTAVIVVIPWFSPSALPADSLCGKLLGPVLGLLETVLPTASGKWIAALRAHPCLALATFLALLLLVLLRQKLKAWGTDLANAGWYDLYPKHRTRSSAVLEKAKRNPLLKLARWARRSTALRRLRSLLLRIVVDIFVLLLFLPLKIGRWIHSRRCLRGTELQGAEKGSSLQAEECRKVIFLTRDYKQLTGILLIAGETYRIRVEKAAGWFDGSFPASPEGLDDSPGARRLERWAWLFKRHRSAPLMGMMARVQRRLGPFRFPSTTVYIGEDGTIRPVRSGELTLYVNDATPLNVPVLRGLIPGVRAMFYANNRGIARLRISRVRSEFPGAASRD